MNTHNDDIIITSAWAPVLRRGGLVLAVTLGATSGCDAVSEPGDDWDTSHLREASAPEMAVASLSLGSASTCMVTAGGDPKCWGHNDHGQLGRGDLVDIGDDETPASVGDVPLLL
ncbi:MAG: hypothetical protein KDK70_08860 [Myxococcales bacterium]|nr:hypothetical protein [Myxococcales bacterium]